MKIKKTIWTASKEKTITDEYKNTQIKIVIEGHTDNVGEEKENQILSENRSIAVYNYLKQNNIDENRLNYKGYGETKPLVPNESENGRRINRRTSFKIIYLKYPLYFLVVQHLSTKTPLRVCLFPQFYPWGA